MRKLLNSRLFGDLSARWRQLKYAWKSTYFFTHPTCPICNVKLKELYTRTHRALYGGELFKGFICQESHRNHTYKWLIHTKEEAGHEKNYRWFNHDNSIYTILVNFFIDKTGTSIEAYYYDKTFDYSLLSNQMLVGLGHPFFKEKLNKILSDSEAILFYKKILEMQAFW